MVNPSGVTFWAIAVLLLKTDLSVTLGTPLILLSKVIDLIRKEGWEVNNIDSVIVAERPKIKPFVELMKNNISDILQIENSFIGIKATTNEKLGPEGREEGISCHSVVLLEKKE